MNSKEKYMTKSPEFKSDDHKKAWLIKVSQNKCKEFLRFHKRHAAVPLEEVEESIGVTDGMDNIITHEDAILVKQ